jgi:hypothetical protein
MAEPKMACPAEGCDYVGTFRLGRGKRDSYLGWIRDEHPSYPRNHSTWPRNVKPKELGLEMQLGQGPELKC